ncbi:MAG TPA: hypothetical protein VHK26_12655 [Methyloceanibacter sp.]|jgi:hypothetical protein|nr:hypothetical protein [Methyloceanibacter sp.]
MTSSLSDKQQSDKDARLEKARRALLKVLGSLVEAGTLTRKEADAMEAAMEDELIAMRVRGLLSN